MLLFAPRCRATWGIWDIPILYSKHSRWVRPAGWLLLLATALALRLLAGGWWQSRLPAGERFGFGDSQSYWTLAQTIVRGEPYQYGGKDLRIFRTPGYPVLLAGLFAMVGDDPPVMWARALSAVLGVLAVAGVACLAWQLFDERAAWIAGLLTTFYPGAVAMSVMVLSEAPFCPCLLLQINCWTWAWRGTRRGPQILAGLLAGAAGGVATLMRPSWLLFTPAALIAALLLSRQRRRHLWLGVWLLLGLIITMAPWWIRNYKIVGRFVPTTLQVGASLYDGWSPQANGGSDMRFVDEFRRLQREADARLTGPPAGTFEERLDRRMREAAVTWAWQHPGDAARLAVVKFVRMWNIWPNAGELQSTRLRLLILLGYVPLLALGAAGIWLFADRGWPLVLCLLPAAYLTLLHLIFVSSIRYRQPAMLPICALAAGTLAACWGARRAARGDGSPGAALLK
jgi:4-amino-4-deoxy-L-arabinose transferase-like glycosyltransferase